jgi:hypothetical protein
VVDSSDAFTGCEVVFFNGVLVVGQVSDCPNAPPPGSLLETN